MSLPELFFTERQKHLLSWVEGGPVLAHVEDAETLRITSPTPHGETRTPHDIAVTGDALLYAQASESFVSFALDGDRLDVTHHALDGTRHGWSTALPTAPRGRWALQDVIATRSATGGTGFALTVVDEDEDEEEGEAEGDTLLLVAEGAGTVSHRPRAIGTLVHWDEGAAVVVLREDRGPFQPQLHAEPLDDPARPVVTTEGRWLDGRDGKALVLTDAPGAPRLALWNLRDGSLRHPDAEAGPEAGPGPEAVSGPDGSSGPGVGPGSGAASGPVDDARFIGAGTSSALVVRTYEGTDRAWLLDLASGAAEPLDTPGAGRLLLRAATPRGAGLYGLSTTEGTSYRWIGPDGTVECAPGAVPPDPALTPPAHTYLGSTPALVYEPPGGTTAAVIALHGGPESQERDELRWDGLYRELLHRGVLVVGLDYTGSSGHGDAFLRRPWKDWETAFRRDLDACLTALRDRGVTADRTALLGGSFGGSLALLGCVLAEDLAGAVAAAPLTDIRRQAARAAADDARYTAWFSERYDLASPLARQRTFDPEHLTTAGPKQRVVIVHGENDRVTSFEDSSTLVARARELGLPWSLTADASGHVPDDADEARFRHDQVRDALAAVLDLP
ncbi:S9 family peptidase [Streptomyces lateritius]|uniref:alpha/beta hydrolase family protein n=1 Tax=Streptomyces lateritius TaxID=67313 RepID=UPI001C8BC537|nr:prolyl oligopeptidase family serine peptidase [Streptomyces lateritius]MBX9424302.1 prolyl oligopeptidase family serine peptidase [Streptomyces lateritius]